MPADLFLKLGNVKGESVDLKHAGEMELLSARWGMQVAVGANGGVLASAGRAEVISAELRPELCRYQWCRSSADIRWNTNRRMAMARAVLLSPPVLIVLSA